jgi:hypothetical protein
MIESKFLGPTPHHEVKHVRFCCTYRKQLWNIVLVWVPTVTQSYTFSYPVMLLLRLASKTSE